MDDLRRRQGKLWLWRCSLESKIWKSGPAMWQVWSWCLIRAAWEDRSVSVSTGRGTTSVKLERGQFICGRNSAAQEIPISPNTIRSCLQRLSSPALGGLRLDTRPNYTLVTVLNFAAYQDACPADAQAFGQAIGQATGQANTTKKELKNSRKGAAPPKPPARAMPEIPASLDTAEFRDAWAKFVQHRAESGSRNKLTPTAAECRMKECERLGPDRAARAIIYSIAQGWRGIYEEKPQQGTASSNGFQSATAARSARIIPGVPTED